MKRIETRKNGLRRTVLVGLLAGCLSLASSAHAVVEPPQMAMSNGKIYAIKSSTGQVYELNAAGSGWTRVGERATAIVANGVSLYVISPDPAGTIWQYQGSPGRWIQIGDRAGMLAADGCQLYALRTSPAKTIWKYNGQPNSWSQIGGDCGLIAARDGQLYCVNATRHSLLLYQGGTNWWYIGSTVNAVSAGYLRAFVTHLPSDALWEVNFAVEPASSKYLHQDVAMIAAAGATLGTQRVYVVNSKNSSIWEVNPTVTPASSVNIENTGNTRSIAVLGGKLYKINKDGSIWQYTGTPLQWRQLPAFPTS